MDYTIYHGNRPADDLKQMREMMRYWCRECNIYIYSDLDIIICPFSAHIVKRCSVDNAPNPLCTSVRIDIIRDTPVFTKSPKRVPGGL